MFLTKHYEIVDLKVSGTQGRKVMSNITKMTVKTAAKRLGTTAA